MLSAEQPLYLSSLESYRFEPVRECWLVRLIEFDTGKPCALVRLRPGVIGQDFGVPGTLDPLLLAARLKGAPISAIDKFPYFVYIGIPSADWDKTRKVISSGQVQVIGWGELYRSPQDAARHSFG